jgi:sugar lactone lactonase YvrE
MRRSTVVPLLLGLGAVALSYLLLWPVRIQPVAWHASPPPARTGVLAPNDRLRAVERVGQGQVPDPEATAIDAAGRVHAGTADGRVVRVDPARGTVETVARTGGRPLGLAFDAAGRLYVADARRGLLRVEPTGAVALLADSEGGRRFGLTDDVAVAPDGTVYFTDASDRFGIEANRDDILEHGGRGRLLSLDPGSGKVSTLLSGLQFANGVAVPDHGRYLVVAETGSHRLLRLWLSGDRRGTAEPFGGALPGYPDNVTWSPERRAFWVALWPRVAVADALAPHPFLRKVVPRLPRWIQPDPEPRAWIVAVDEEGRIVESLEWLSPDAYHPVTSVRERDGWLWLGSLSQDALGRLAAPPIAR